MDGKGGPTVLSVGLVVSALRMWHLDLCGECADRIRPVVADSPLENIFAGRVAGSSPFWASKPMASWNDAEVKRESL